LRCAGGAIHHGARPCVATTQGYVLAFRIGATLAIVGGLLNLLLMERVSPTLRNPVAESAGTAAELV